MSRLTKWMDRTFYPLLTNNWDDVMFREAIEKRVNPDSMLLDYGAGRGNISHMNFRRRGKFVAGVDPDEAVFQNPYLDEAKVLDLAAGTIPYPDGTFDVCFSDNVMEHVGEPQVVFAEMHRVLKPGGYFLAKTPNKWHYMPMIARCTPTGFHKFYNRLRGRDAKDTFPTLYRCNTRRALIGHARRAGFEVSLVRFIEGRPEYLRMTVMTYVPGLIYERLVNAFRALSGIRCVLLFELRKPLA